MLNPHPRTTSTSHPGSLPFTVIPARDVQTGTIRFHLEPANRICNLDVFRFHLEPRFYMGLEEISMTATSVVDAPITKIRGRETRSQSIATRFTPSEEQQLLRAAEAKGQNLREWARDVLLRAAGSEACCEMDQHVFTELVGIQLLLMDTWSLCSVATRLSRIRFLCCSVDPNRRRQPRPKRFSPSAGIRRRNDICPLFSNGVVGSH